MSGRPIVELRHADGCGSRLGKGSGVYDTVDGPVLRLVYPAWAEKPSARRMQVMASPLADLSPTTAFATTCKRHGWVTVRAVDIRGAVDEYRRTGRRQVLAVRSNGMLDSR